MVKFTFRLSFLFGLRLELGLGSRLGPALGLSFL